MSLHWPSQLGLIRLDTIDSTNEEARRRLPDLDRPTWILAAEQTQGRGRRGKVWKAPAGNMNASFISPLPDGGLATAALQSFVAAMALADTLDEITGLPEQVSLKWPNDVLLNGGKLAGILLETMSTNVQPSHLCVGVGVNLMHTPKVETDNPPPFPPVDLLTETGLKCDPLTFLTHLALAFLRRDRQRVQHGFSPLRDQWLKRAARLGQTVKAKAGHREWEGIFQTVDDDGALVLNCQGTQHRLAAADIHFPAG